MNISRFNADFGNSNFMGLSDGYYIEIPTNVVEISKEKAEGLLPSAVDDKKEFLDKILLSVPSGDKEKYYLVGKLAETEFMATNHIRKPHNKVESHIPYVIFLAASAYYLLIKGEPEETEITIENMQCMLPIWLLKKLNKFSEMQNKMADRFKGEHSVNVHTPGLEREIKISVKEAKCRIESEVARWAIKKNVDLEDNPEAEQFKNFEVVMVDLGGGTDDLVHLQPGLGAPINRDSFEYYADVSFLHHLEKLRKEKLVEHFSDVRSLEQFIYENVKKSKMERRNGNTGETVNLTDTIKKSLKEYAGIKVTQAMDAFPAPQNKVYKYVYIGGVATVLEEALKEVATERFGEEIAEANHIVHPQARELNLYALEIISRSEEAKKKQTQSSVEA